MGIFHTILLKPTDAVWSPLDLGENLVLWFDGATIGSDGSVVDGGNLLGQWFDKSTNTRHYIQSTTGFKPLWDGSEKVTFDGIDNVMTVPGSKSQAWQKDFHDGTAVMDVAIKINIIPANPDVSYTIMGSGVLTVNIGFALIYDDRSSSSRNNKLRAFVVNSTGGQAPVINTTSDDFLLPQSAQWIRFTIDPANATPADRSVIYNESTSESNNVNSFAPNTGGSTFDLGLGGLGGAFGNFDIYEIITADRKFTSQEWNFIKAR